MAQRRKEGAVNRVSGWIKIHREIFDSDIWHDVTTFRLFVYLIGKASHQDGLKYKGMTLNKGQFVRSYRKLADDLAYKEGRGVKKYSLSTIKSAVNKLVEAERVSIKDTEIGTLFTITNYEIYQKNDLETTNAVREFTLETTNVNRTEVRTGEMADKDIQVKGFEGVGLETPNAINSEVRTNTELMPNEVRTKSEQDQELKNLRIKELKKESNKDIKNNTPPNPLKGEKVKYADYVFLTENEYEKLTELLGEEERDRYFLEFASWISGQTKRVQTNRSAYLTILNWFRREQAKPKRNVIDFKQPSSQYQRKVSKLDELYREAAKDEQVGNY